MVFNLIRFGRYLFKEYGENSRWNNEVVYRVGKNVTAGAYYNIALAYFALGEYAKSEEAFNKATEFDKNVTIMHQVLAKTAADMEMRKQLQ